MSEIVGARYEVRRILGYAWGILGYARPIPEYGCEFMGKKCPMGLMGKKCPIYGEKETTPQTGFSARVSIYENLEYPSSY